MLLNAVFFMLLFVLGTIVETLPKALIFQMFSFMPIRGGFTIDFHRPALNNSVI
jgi:hypothetical protein